MVTCNKQNIITDNWGISIDKDIVTDNREIQLCNAKLEDVPENQDIITKQIETVQMGDILQHAKRKTREPHAVPTFVCQGPSFYLKFFSKKNGA